VIDRLIAWAVRRRGTVLFLVLALAAGGAWAFSSLPVDAFPELSSVQVEVFTEAPGMSPLEVERLVTYPVEVALTGIPAVDNIYSVSRYGLSVVRVVFEDGTDIYFARTRVAEALQAVRAELPAGAEIELAPLSGSIGEIYQYTLTGDGQSLMELRTIQDRIVRPQLRTVPGVADVNSWGGVVRQVSVTVQPARLAAHGVTLDDVVSALQGNTLRAASGYIERADEQYILRGLGQAQNPEDVGNTVIRAGPGGTPVTVGDVADVGYGAQVRQGAVTQDAQGEVVTGIVMALRGVNSRELVKRIRERVAEIDRALPEGVRIVPYYDQSELVEGTLRTVEHNLLLGGFLVISILLLFLGNVRAALLVAATIPLSLLFAFVGMRWLGLSANLMSLGAIDFGMIVDGSIVMSEHFIKELHRDEERGSYPRTPAMLAGRLIQLGQDVGRPVLFGVLIILLVYVPVVTLQGLEGRMFRPMAITVATALFGSLLLAMAFIPAASTLVFRSAARESRLALRLAAWLDRTYAPLVRGTMARPVTTVGVAVGAFALSLLLVPTLGTEFLPELDEGSFQLTAMRDPTISLDASLDMQRRLEQAVLRTPEVTTVVSQVGRAEIATDPAGVDRGEVFVMLEPRSRWRPGVTTEDLREEMEKHLEEYAPGLSVAFSQPVANRLDELTSGVRADLAIKIFGDDADTNRRVAEQIAQVVMAVPGAAEVQVPPTTGQTYLNVTMDRSAMARFGIPLAAAQRALAAAVSGEEVAEVVEGNFTTDVVVLYPPELRSSPEAIGAIAVAGAGGARVPLRSFATFALESGPIMVQREGGQRLVVVQANVSGRDLGGFAAAVQDIVRRQVDVPPGVFVRYGGSFENQQRATARLRLVLPLSILVIALLLYSSLQSWTLAAIVLLNLPFAAIGGVAALWLRGLHLSVSAAIGFIALFGVAVLNGLVLLTTVQRAHAGGTGARLAAELGARERLRPVLMTAAVASIGFVPVALSRGTGAEVQRPLATVVIGGLITSTLLTLFVLPTLYAWVHERRDRWRGRFRSSPETV
jgi:heavy metal efflux system protein